MTPIVHDLLRIDADVVIARDLARAPRWTREALAHTPWVVVRRPLVSSGIAVGIRGPQRARRFATRIALDAVRERRSPEDLSERAVRFEGRLGAAARRIAAFARAEGLAWGPTGSFGFELATGRPVTTPASDLDVVVRASGFSRETFVALDRVRADIAATLDVAVDGELTFDVGGVNLREFVALPATVLVKTGRGTKLIPCP